MMNIEQARFNMIEQQIRPTNVNDPVVLQLLNSVKREAFFPAAQKNLAFTDTQLPIAEGVFSLAPKVEAKIVQALDIQAHHTVLVIGADTGYLAALFAKQAKFVTVVEALPAIKNNAEENLKKAGIKNVEVELADPINQISGDTYDVIVLTGSLEYVPEHVQKQLNVGGKLFIITGNEPVMVAQLITRESDLFFNTKNLFETVVGRLSQAKPLNKFTF